MVNLAYSTGKSSVIQFILRDGSKLVYPKSALTKATLSPDASEMNVYIGGQEIKIRGRELTEAFESLCADDLVRIGSGPTHSSTGVVKVSQGLKIDLITLEESSQDPRHTSGIPTNSTQKLLANLPPF